jgi:predicted RND superfamily exporter protein
VRIVLAWFPARLDLPERWYDEVAARVEMNPPEGVKVRMTSARMVGFELKRSVFRDCAWITVVVGLCVSISLGVALRSVGLALLAALPLGFAYVFMLAAVPFSQYMGWDFSLNFVNLMMFPLLLGSAIDYGVYMVFDAYSPRRPSLTELMSQTGRSVLYCMGTTLIAFGSFVTSSYTGLSSMGIASLWGYAGALFGALVVLPALLGTLRRRTE